ncbi:FadR family transcriptional regulator [Burkholderia pseudomallei]|nr:FadR family transcriptional regulator [Burkholderia pseudomallei]
MPTAQVKTTARVADPESQATFSPIKTKRAFEEVCDQIRREVAAGKLRPGDRLPPERDFAEQLGVSRTAIREAMRSLENAGLVRCYQGMGGGAFIRERDSSVVTQAVSDMVMLGQIPSSSVTEARIMLTEQAIRLACIRATEDDLDAIERDIDKAEELTLAGNFSRRGSYITEFYRLLASATHNQVIVMLVESLSELVRAQMAQVSVKPRKDFIAVRRSVLRHLRTRDADAAAAEIRKHLERLDRYIQDDLEEKMKSGTQKAEFSVR